MSPPLLWALAWLLAPPSIPLGDGAALVGVITEQAPLGCKGDLSNPEEVWGAPYYEAGFVRLVPDDGVSPADLVGRPAVVLGAPLPGPAPARSGGCLPRQMRSDWILGKHGVRIARGTPPHVAFRAAKLVALDGLVAVERAPGEAAEGQAAGTADTLSLTVRNVFDRPLKDLTLRVHHEGCYGKPGSTAAEAKRAALAPGEVWTASLPAFEARQRRPHPARDGEWHAARSVTLDAGGERIAFDLDVPLSSLGVSVVCPDER